MTFGRLVLMLLLVACVARAEDPKDDVCLRCVRFGGASGGCACPTPTVAPPPQALIENGTLFFWGDDNLATGDSYMLTRSSCDDLSTSNCDVESRTQFFFPEITKSHRIAGFCTGGGGRTFIQRKNGVDTDVQCSFGGGTQCTFSTTPVQWDAFDKYSMRNRVDVSPASAGRCYFITSLLDEFNNPYDGTIIWSGEGQPATGEFCGAGASDPSSEYVAAAECEETDENTAAFIIPCTGTVKYMTLHVENALASGVVEEYVLRHNTDGRDLPSAGSMIVDGDAGCTEASAANRSCTQEAWWECATPTSGPGTPTPTPGGCDVTAGERLVVRADSVTGVPAADYRNFVITIDGCGAIVTAIRDVGGDSNTARMSHRHTSIKTTEGAQCSGEIRYFVWQASTVRNIFAAHETAPTAVLSYEICTCDGALCTMSNPGSLSGIDCDISSPATSCNDTSTIDNITQWAASRASCEVEGSSGWTKCAYEIVGAATPTSTPTP